MRATGLPALFLLLSGRTALREPGRTILTLAGVALGMSVVVAIRLANASTIDSFNQSVQSLSGAATIQIRKDAGGLDENLLRTVLLHPGVRTALPILEQTVAVRGREDDDLTLLGVDLLSDSALRAYAYSGYSGDETDAVIESLADPRAIFLTERYAAALGLRAGDSTTLLIGSRPETVNIALLLRNEGPAAAYGGRIAVMDMAAAQFVLRRFGELDRIDVAHDETRISAPDLIESLQAALPPGVIVERPEMRTERAETMMATFRMNCNALAGVALLVGAFLIYNSVSISVVRRRQDIGTLRSLGARRGAIRAVFLAEGAILGALGSLFGLALGCVLAQSIVGLVSRAVGYHYVRTEAGEAVLTLAETVLALVLGVAVAVAAALAPAFEASRTEPASVARRGAGQRSRRRRTRNLLLTGVALLVTAAVCWRLPPVLGLPLFGFLSGGLILTGFALLSLPGIALVNGLLRGPMARLFGAEGALASAGITGSPGRIAVAVCGLMVGFALVSSISIMIHSFRDTVDIWLEQMIRADVYVGPPSQGAAARDGALDPEIAAILSRLDGVEAIDPFRARDVLYQGRRITVGGGDLRVFASRARLVLVEGDLETALDECLNNGAVLVSEPLANFAGLRRGDTLHVPTPRGPHPMRVAGVYYEYSSTLGYVNMDRSVFLGLYEDAALSSVSLYLRPGTSPAGVRDAALSALGPRHQVRIYLNRELRNEALRVFDETFRVTTALEIIAILVSVLGVAATLSAVTADRRDEIVTLRFLGASRRQIARMVLCESLLLGLAGVILGLAAGGLLSLLLIEVINKQSFGWTIQFHPPVGLVVQLTVLVLAATLISGWFPARRAANLDVRYEKVTA